MPYKDVNTAPAPENSKQNTAADVSSRNTTASKTKNPAKGAASKRPEQKNTFVPGQHGLMITEIVQQNGQRVVAIGELYDSLIARFGLANPIVALMIELAVVDYWRLAHVHRAEKRVIDSRTYAFEPRGIMPTLIRYNAAARRNLEKSLEILEESTDGAGSTDSESEPTASVARDNGASAVAPEPNSGIVCDEGCPDKIDPRDFLPESEFEHTRNDLSEDSVAASDRDRSDSQLTPSTPVVPIDTATTSSTAPAVETPPDETGGNNDSNSGGDLPSAA